MFADDFTPSLTVRANLLYENDCTILSGNCAQFMMKSVNISAIDNIVADSNYTGVVRQINPFRLDFPFITNCSDRPRTGSLGKVTE